MRDLNEVNLNEGGKPVRRVPPPTEVLNHFQATYGLRLPSQYVEFLSFCNGGHPELDSFVPNNRIDRWAVDKFYYLLAEDSDSANLWNAMRSWQGILGKNCVPIACDGGGNQIFLDVKQELASVKLCIHDQNFKVIPIADSFSKFVELLSSDPDMI